MRVELGFDNSLCLVDIERLNCVLQASQMPIMGTSCVTILRLRFGMNTDGQILRIHHRKNVTLAL